VFRGKPGPLPLCPQQIPRVLQRDLPWVSILKMWRLIISLVAQPSEHGLYGSLCKICCV